MEVSFTSTYRVPFKQPRKGVKPGQIDILKDLALRYGGIVPSGRKGNAKFSCRMKFDADVKRILKYHGFTSYQNVPIHNVPNAQIVDALNYEGRFESLKKAGQRIRKINCQALQEFFASRKSTPRSR